MGEVRLLAANRRRAKAVPAGTVNRNRTESAAAQQPFSVSFEAAARQNVRRNRLPHH